VTKSCARAERLRIKVSGPGQKRVASFLAGSGTSLAHEKACVEEAKWTITG
jgi:hypothetical protein